MQKTFSVVGHKQTALLSHREAVGKQLAGPCLKAFQGYLPPQETRNTRETIYTQSDCSYQDQLDLGLSSSESTEKETTFISQEHTDLPRSFQAEGTYWPLAGDVLGMTLQRAAEQSDIWGVLGGYQACAKETELGSAGFQEF